MTDVQLLQSGLTELWARQARKLGSSTVHDIARSAGESDAFVPAKGGVNIDLEYSFKILIEAATLLKISLEIWKTMKELYVGERKSEGKQLLEDTVKADNRYKKLRTEVKDRLSDVVDWILNNVV